MTRSRRTKATDDRNGFLSSMVLRDRALMSADRPGAIGAESHGTAYFSFAISSAV